MYVILRAISLYHALKSSSSVIYKSIMCHIYPLKFYFHHSITSIFTTSIYIFPCKKLFTSYQSNQLFLLINFYFADPSAKLDTAQHWPSIGKNFSEDRLPISCHYWNDNFGMHLAATSGPNSGRQHLFSAQQRADAVPTLVFRGKSDT